MINPFENTIILLRDRVNQRLRPGVSKIWIQGVNASTARLVFTLHFEDHSRGYEMRFLDVKNFRHFRPDGDLENENRLLDLYITQFSKILSDVIE